MRLENHLLSILESLHDAVIVIANDSRVVYVNKAYSTQFGVPAKKLIGRKLKDVEAEARILTVLRTGKPLINDCSYVHSLNKDVCANMTPLMENGEMIGVVTIMKDISEFMMLQEELKKYKDHLSELQKQLDQRNFAKLTSVVPEMQKAVELSKQVAQSDATIMIYGESGVGKEIFAKAIHEASNRSQNPFIPINMASIPDALFESEMFGYEEGSFTGSRKGGKKGLFEMANGGTLLLDEIGEMSLNVQSKLLRVIQERKFHKVGGTKLYPLDVRIICATNRNLMDQIKNGSFREDLYYRINVVPITIPPLRRRKDDIEFLTNSILKELCLKYSKHVTVDEDVFVQMKKYDWPGNVRELFNVLERMIAICTKSYIELADLPESMFTEELTPLVHSLTKQEVLIGKQSLQLNDILEKTEKEYIEFIVKRSRTKSDAIRQLGISRKAFYAKLKKYQIQ